MNSALLKPLAKIVNDLTVYNFILIYRFSTKTKRIGFVKLKIHKFVNHLLIKENSLEISRFDAVD
jgi:hypothetical protein